ncbi:MAG: hypothetical protein K0B02_02760 [DPANN group archaeon]|nr:hypothetical protein [DPANN group archaeon]
MVKYPLAVKNKIPNPEEQDEFDESWEAVYRLLGVGNSFDTENHKMHTLPTTNTNTKFINYLDTQTDTITNIKEDLESMNIFGYESQDKTYLEKLVKDISENLEYGEINKKQIEDAKNLRDSLKQEYITWQNNNSRKDLHEETKEWYKIR